MVGGYKISMAGMAWKQVRQTCERMGQNEIYIEINKLLKWGMWGKIKIHATKHPVELQAYSKRLEDICKVDVDRAYAILLQWFQYNILCVRIFHM